MLRQGEEETGLNAQRATIRAVNRTIRDFAVDPRVPSDEDWDFFCECGCFALVSLSVDAFDRDGEVWLPGHEAERLLSA